MSAGIRDLKLWQEAVGLAADLTRTVHGCSRRETRQLTDRLLHVALDVPARIADGYERAEQAERVQLYRQARGDLAVLDTLLAVTRQAGLVTPAAQAQLTARCTVVARLLGGYLAAAERCRRAEA